MVVLFQNYFRGWNENWDYFAKKTFFFVVFDLSGVLEANSNPKLLLQIYLQTRFLDIVFLHSQFLHSQFFHTLGLSEGTFSIKFTTFSQKKTLRTYLFHLEHFEYFILPKCLIPNKNFRENVGNWN